MVNENYLAHYGVLGMKWGVRRYQNKDGSLTKAGKVRYGSKTGYYTDPTTGDTVIKKGTSINRLSVYDESASVGHAYVTYLKSDTEHYKGFFGARLKRMNNDAPVYSIEMKAKKDLWAPSQDKRVQTFMDLYKNDPNIGVELGRYHKEWSTAPAVLPKKVYELQYSKLSDKKLETKGYDTFVRALGGNEYVRNEYFKALSAKGYSFVNDDMDGGDGFGKAPSIIFDRKASTKYIGQKEVSSDEIKEIWKREGTYVEGTKRTPSNVGFEVWAKNAWRVKSSSK